MQTIRVGVVSSASGIQDVTSWISRFNEGAILSKGNRPFVDQSFPGFRRSFRSTLIASDDFNEELLSREISELLEIPNSNLRIRRAANLYAAKVRNICRKVSRPDLVICHEPSEVEAKCGAGMTQFERRRGALPADEKERAAEIKKNVETHYLLAPLDEDTQNLIDMVVNQDFRALLKSSCLEYPTPIQILTQSILERMTETGQSPVLDKGQDPSSIAWNLAAAIYYKSNHSPWRCGHLEPGTCFVGISFYFDKMTSQRDMHASLAQVFSDTGEGMVVRGGSFKWDVKERGAPHLGENSARSLLANAVKVYAEHHNGQAPNRVVVHKSSRYEEDEKNGFIGALSAVPKYDLVSIGTGADYFFYRNGDNPVLRNTCIPFGRSYLVYTQGFIPYQRGYHKPRIPHPLEITDHRGDSTLDQISKEILALTRLNWNTTDYCIFKPVTLEFSARVGDILGRVPEGAIIKEPYYFYM